MWLPLCICIILTFVKTESGGIVPRTNWPYTLLFVVVESHHFDNVSKDNGNEKAHLEP